MTVGLTYDLRAEWLAEGFSELETAEFDREETVDAIENAVGREGHATERIGNYRGLMKALAAGEKWDLVFNICEGMYGLGREALVPALLDAYRIPYTFSDPVVLGLALHKGLMKRVVRDAGVPTPDFAIVESEAGVDAVGLRYPLFAKPLAEGTGKGIGPHSRIVDASGLSAVCVELLEMYRQPVLVEEYLPGREFTTGIIGTGVDAEAVGTMEVTLLDTAEAHAYSYLNKEYCEERVRYTLVDGNVAEGCANLALRTWQALGGRDAGRIDFRMDGNGALSFIEVNPLAGLHPKHSDLPIICAMVGMDFQELVARILASARRRVGS
jgi:D-alanine-D-alanine ligase